jgi:hypothetical protein
MDTSAVTRLSITIRMDSGVSVILCQIGLWMLQLVSAMSCPLEALLWFDRHLDGMIKLTSVLGLTGVELWQGRPSILSASAQAQNCV